ncbi:serine/threonine protein phosphatase, partial [Burkholderia pseudomallei]
MSYNGRAYFYGLPTGTTMPRPIHRAAALSLTLAGAALFHASTSSVDNQPHAASAPANIHAACVEIG